MNVSCRVDVSISQRKTLPVCYFPAQNIYKYKMYVVYTEPVCLFMYVKLQHRTMFTKKWKKDSAKHVLKQNVQQWIQVKPTKKCCDFVEFRVELA